ncbi:hypothetical protein Hgul01_03986 [Herpetosiphon gulosus]|uniref:Uncharacterized protein n=1 Tax=Herpetosiphon gulosus TaxID=1973496 RepID=A0ABP9X6H6_9CHLR
MPLKKYLVDLTADERTIRDRVIISASRIYPLNATLSVA